MYRTNIAPRITPQSVDRLARRPCTGPYDRGGAVRELVVAIYLDRRAHRIEPEEPQEPKRASGTQVGVGCCVARAKRLMLPGSKIFGIERRIACTNGRRR